MRISNKVAALGFILALASGWASAQQTYRLTDLGTLGGGPSFGFAINASGQVTGYSYRTGVNGVGAFLWNGTEMLDLGMVGGLFAQGSSQGNDINDLGQVTGWAYTSANKQHAFLWNGTTMQDLGTLGGTYSYGTAINASGQVTGESLTTDDAETHAFLWNGTAMQDLGTLGGTSSYGTAINASGQVTGESWTSGGENHAFLWESTNGMQDLGTLGGSYSEAYAINALGQVVGNSPTTGNAELHAFLWNGTTMQDLGTLGGTFSKCCDRFVNNRHAINASGQVTGYANTTSNAVIHAFLWTGTAMQDLGTPEGFTRSEGHAINASGQVVGVAYTAGGGPVHPFLSGGGQIQDLNALIDPTDPLRPFVTLNFGGGINDLGRYGLDINDLGQITAHGCDSRKGSGGWAECNAYVLTPIPIVGPIHLPDTNSDGVKDIAVIRDEPIRAEIRSGKDGALVTTIAFLDSSMIPLDAQALPDSDGNGIPELAVLAIRKSDNRGVVELRNITGTPAARRIWFRAGYMPLSLAVIESDADNNGIAELAVLSRRHSDSRGLVEVKNAFGTPNLKSIWMGVGLTPLDLEIVDDADKNGVPEVAVLSRRNSDARIVVEVKNAAGANNPHTVSFMLGNTAIDLEIVNDADGNTVPELAVLSSRNSDGRNVVEVKNAAGALNPSATWFVAGNRALALQQVADADGNSVPEIAVLSVRNSDGRVFVRVKNAVGATQVSNLLYPAGFTARDLAILDDVDGNGIQEAAVLMVRDSDGRILVQSRNAAGVLGTKNYWISP